MPLITTIAEFQTGVPVSVNTSIELLQTPLASAERRHLVPVLGQPQYQALVTAYQASLPQGGAALSELQQQLLGLVQVALANLAFAPHVTVAQLLIDDAGIRTTSDGNHNTARQWQIDDLREYLRETGYAALEDVLAFLDENKNEFPLWAQSQAYTYNKQLLLNRLADFQRYYNIGNSRRTFLALLPILEREEVFSLEPALSSEFCAALRAEIQTGAVSAATQAVLRLLWPALANFTVGAAMSELSVDLADGGLVVRELAVGGDNNRVRRQAPPELLAVKREQALGNGRLYLRKLLELLNAQASSTVYPDFFASSCYAAPAPSPAPAAAAPYPTLPYGQPLFMPRRGGLYRAG